MQLAQQKKKKTSIAHSWTVKAGESARRFEQCVWFVYVVHFQNQNSSLFKRKEFLGIRREEQVLRFLDIVSEEHILLSLDIVREEPTSAKKRSHSFVSRCCERRTHFRKEKKPEKEAWCQKRTIVN